MTPLQLATQYLDIVFSGEALGRLEALLAADCSFRGPFYSYDSAAEYVRALEADPPADFRYEMIRSFETATSAALFYRFTKPGVDVPMAQLFDVEDGRITRMLLIFDGAAF